MWELCLAANSVPGTKNAFPICTTDAHFDKALQRRRLTGLSACAVAEIRELQPYTHGQDYQSSNLWLLDELCNINKHRRVLLAEVRWRPF